MTFPVHTFTVTKDDKAWEVELRGDGNARICEEIRDKISQALERGDVVLVISVPENIELVVRVLA